MNPAPRPHPTIMPAKGIIRPGLAALLLIITGAACHAQDGAVTLRFLSFPKSIDPEPVELLTGEGRTIEVEIPSNELSPPYKVPRLAVWSVGETIDGPDGKPVFNEFGRARALSSPSQLILLLRKGAAHSDGFEVLPIDNRVGRFGGGRFLFMNASKVDVAGEVGGETFAVPPGGHTIVTPRAGENGRTFLARFFYRVDKKAKPFFSSKWPTSEQSRGLIFFYQDPDTKRLRLHSIRDFL